MAIFEKKKKEYIKYFRKEKYRYIIIPSIYSTPIACSMDTFVYN